MLEVSGVEAFCANARRRFARAQRDIFATDAGDPTGELSPLQNRSRGRGAFLGPGGLSSDKFDGFTPSVSQILSNEYAMLNYGKLQSQDTGGLHDVKTKTACPTRPVGIAYEIEEAIEMSCQLFHRPMRIVIRQIFD